MNTRIIHVFTESENGKRHPSAMQSTSAIMDTVVLTAVPGCLYLMKNPIATAATMKSVEVHATCEFAKFCSAENVSATPKLFATISEKAATTRMEKKYTKSRKSLFPVFPT